MNFRFGICSTWERRKKKRQAVEDAGGKPSSWGDTAAAEASEYLTVVACQRKSDSINKVVCYAVAFGQMRPFAVASVLSFEGLNQ